MNREIFDTYFETQLAPTLQPGYVVILDNLVSHKSAKAEAILERAFDISDRPTPALGGGEVNPIVGEHGMDLVGDRSDEVQQEVGSDPLCGLLMQLGGAELRDPIDAATKR
ncbi:hypothetical protein RSO01_93590 [Reyranella soli]|uniref:Tc1-like transposase DDE domain-containing protein n=1 Tax=Reyranella soli TaxID=1230389 RepID=A0A512NTA6_9HYPH|nr:hypothetical protein RSO01_93590 [Reyranella soli]